LLTELAGRDQLVLFMEGWGFRVTLSVFGHVPCFFLLTIVPVYAYTSGDIKFPNLMVSDIAAAGPLYRALYTFSFCYNVYCVSLAWTECMKHIKAKIPALAPSASQFLCLFHGLGCPCLIVLSAFQFDETDNQAGYVGLDGIEPSYIDILPKTRAAFISWVVHVVAATLFFVCAAGCALLLGARIIPFLQAHGLIHPKDLAWLRFGSSGIGIVFVAITIFRFLHIFHSRYLWSWPLALSEIAIILLCLVINSMGTLRLLAELDKMDPILDKRDVTMIASNLAIKWL
jgi:hypothetical protein